MSRLDHDIDNFNAQEADNVSSHFEVMLLTPISVDHTKYLDRTAIGNTRKTFESLPQPDHVSIRYIHKKHDQSWSTRELNVPAPRA